MRDYLNAIDIRVLILEQTIPSADSAHSDICEHAVQVEKLEEVSCDVVHAGDPSVGCLSVQNTNDKLEFRRPVRPRFVVPDCAVVLFLAALLDSWGYARNRVLRLRL